MTIVDLWFFKPDAILLLLFIMKTSPSAVCMFSTRVNHIAPSLAPLMSSPLAQAGSSVTAPQAVLQSFRVSDADVLQVPVEYTCG